MPDPSSSDTSAEDEGYHPPESPEQDHFLSLGLKVALAMLVADFVARRLGFEAPTWSVLTAAFLATAPPVASAKAAGLKLVALAVGVALGTAGAFAASWLESVPSIHFAIVGFVAGALGSRSADYLFAAVVGTVITFIGSGGEDPLGEVVVRTTAMILIGCAVGPVVVWVVERVKRAGFKNSARRAAEAGALLLALGLLAASWAPLAYAEDGARAGDGPIVERRGERTMLGSAMGSLRVQDVDGNEIGDVTDTVIGHDGRLQTLVVGLGGWAGLGERDVGIAWDRFTVKETSDGIVLVCDVDRLTLEGAPTFERRQ